MDFYFDENYSHHIASALHELERSENVDNVYSTALVFGRSVKDVDLIPMIAEKKGVLITKDQNMGKRKAEYELLQRLGVSTIFIKATMQTHWQQIETIIRHWRKLKEICYKSEKDGTFFLRLNSRGKIEKM